MRLTMSIIAVLLVVLANLPLPTALAQERPLSDLLPTASQIGSNAAIVDDRSRGLAEQATGFANPPDAARLLRDWGWQENVFRVYQVVQDPNNALTTVDISLTRFSSSDGAQRALPYFLDDRVAILGESELSNPLQLGDETRAISGAVEGGADTTLYVRQGALLLRVSVTAGEGAPPISAERLAQGMLSLSQGQAQEAAPLPSLAAALPQTLPLAQAECLGVAGEGTFTLPAIEERFAGVLGMATALQDLGWQEGVYRQFGCANPPRDQVGWVDIGLYRFGSDAAAEAAVPLFATARASSTRLQASDAPGVGTASAALAGPGVNGADFTLYFSTGSYLASVTGVAPAGNPRPDVEAVAMALEAQLQNLAPSSAPASPAGPVSVGEATVTPQPTPLPTLPPTAPAVPTIAPVATATPPPAIAPQPTATFAPTPVPIPTETPVPTLIPVVIPTATPVPTLIPVVIPTPIPQPTLTPAPPAATLPPSAGLTPTPRVIHPPTG